MSYLTTNKSAIDWTEFDIQINKVSIVLAEATSYSSGREEYLKVLKREQEAIAKYFQFPWTKDETAITSPNSLAQDLELYTKILNEFYCTLICNNTFAIVSLDSLSTIKKGVARIRASDNFNDSTSFYLVDPNNFRKANIIASDFYMGISSFTDFRTSTEKLQTSYNTVTTERNRLLAMIETLTNRSNRTGGPFLQAVKMRMIRSTNEMEICQPIHVDHLMSYKRNYEACLDWMLRKQKICFDLPKECGAVLDEYSLWLARVEGDNTPNPWVWDARYGVSNADATSDEGDVAAAVAAISLEAEK